jgi:hypothetical protein
MCEHWLNHFLSYRLMCAALMVLLQGLLFLVVHQLVGYFFKLMAIFVLTIDIEVLYHMLYI